MELISQSCARNLGLKFYTTGKPCKRNHVCERWVSNGDCVECRKLYNETYYVLNAESVKNTVARYRAVNLDKCRLQQKASRKKHPETRRHHNFLWRKRHPEYNKRYVKDRCERDPEFKLRTNLRSRLKAAMRAESKKGSAVRDLGCSISEFKLYLESKFLQGMTWANYGNKPGQWSIDHIRPLSKFDLTDRPQFLEACHYTNMQPLWHLDNLKKGNRSA